MIKTRVTELLGIERPIIQGGIQNWGTPELASAVSNAGGLGTINVTIYPELPDFRQAVQRMKTLTDKPFCVNISMLPTVTAGEKTADYIAICGEEDVRVIETAGRSPVDLVPLIHEQGILHIHKCPTVRHALSAEKSGVDAVTIVGLDCAGHPSIDEIGTIVLANKAAQKVKIPLIAGGGVADGRGMAALLAMGVDGVIMGTRFMAVKECLIHENIKQWILNMDEKDTVLCQRSIGNMVRMARNDTALLCLGMESRNASLKELLPIISGARGKKAGTEGDTQGGMISLGTAVGLIEDIPTVQELLDRIMEEAEEARSRLDSLFVR